MDTLNNIPLPKPVYLMVNLDNLFISWHIHDERYQAVNPEKQHNILLAGLF